MIFILLRQAAADLEPTEVRTHTEPVPACFWEKYQYRKSRLDNRIGGFVHLDLLDNLSAYRHGTFPVNGLVYWMETQRLTVHPVRYVEHYSRCYAHLE